jgi:SAM-dependent methyltransferase
MQQSLRSRLKRTPYVGTPLLAVNRMFRRTFSSVIVPGSAEFWDKHYARGRTSGEGSYGRHAEFKARVLNAFVVREAITSVLELGCGDGNQLALATYPRYVGLDVSPHAVRRCAERFQHDTTKSFFCYEPSAFFDRAGVFQADATLSLDVIYHLLEDQVYETYMTQLFSAATRFVVVYSSDSEAPALPPVRHRRFTEWVSAHRPEWELVEKIDNEHPLDERGLSGSFADFYIYSRRATARTSC